MDKPFLPLLESELISIIGNLLDNAIEATQRAPLPHAPVDVLIKLNEQELIIEVADQASASHRRSATGSLSAASPPKRAAIMVLACI